MACAKMANPVALSVVELLFLEIHVPGKRKPDSILNAVAPADGDVASHGKAKTDLYSH